LATNAKHHPIRAMGRIIDPMFIGNERVRPTAQVHEVAPVRAVARQARHFQANDDPHLSSPDRGDEIPETMT
jgi:hypothetical protein